MARLSCTYRPRFSNVDVTILIHDNQGGIFEPNPVEDPGVDFCTSADGAVVRIEGNTRDVYQAIQPTSCTFDMLIENGSHYAFLDDLALAEENRFTVEVRKGSLTVFVGFVVIDEVVIQDTPDKKYWVTINATDGFADLQNIPYSYEDGFPYSGRAKLTEHLKNIFSHLPSYDLYSNSRVYVFTSMFAKEMPDTSKCPLEQAWVDHSVFQIRSEDKINFMTCYDVLEAILHAFDLRLLTSGWAVYIYAWNFFGNPTKDIHTWIYTLSSMTSGSEGMIAIHPIPMCSPGYESAAGGVKVLQSPARSVTVTYKHGTGKNWLFGQRFMDVGYDDQCYVAGIIPTLDEETRFFFTANIRFFLSKDRNLITNGARFIVLVKIRLGENYYVRPYSLINGSVIQAAPFWTTDEEYYVIPSVAWVERYDETDTYDFSDSENFERLSDIIPESAYGEELEICVTFKLVDRNNNTLSLEDYPASINIENPVFNFVKKDNVLVEDTSNVLRVVNTINNTRDFSRTLLIGDGPNPEASSRITVYDGEHHDTTEWTDYHSGIGPYVHTELIARLMMARRVNTLRFKEGGFYGYDHFLEPLLYDGLIYIPLLPAWVSGQGITDGEFVSIRVGEVADLDHSAVIEDDVRLAPGTPVRPNSGDIVTRPVRKTYNGPLSEIVPTVDIDFVLNLPIDEQASIVHLYRNGVKMTLKEIPTGINDFQIVDSDGAKLRPAIPLTAADLAETNFFL